MIRPRLYPLRGRLVRSRSNSSFSLIEVLIAIGILSTGIIFVFQSFAAALTATRLSQNITVACFLAQNKMWEIEEALREGPDFEEEGTEKINEREFAWSAELDTSGAGDLKPLTFRVEWREKAGQKKNSLELATLVFKAD